MGKTLTFRRGVHPREAAGGKHETGAKPIENAAAPSIVAVPLLQHAGAPAKPMVKPGTPVLMGQKIAAADGYVSAAVHSPVSGIVKSIQTRIAAGGRRVDAVIIENNALDEWDTSLLPVRDPDEPAQLLAAIREAGVVGMGGATFPTHVKLSPPREKPIDTLILNGAECEPYLSADHRVMLEETEAVVDGLRIAAKITGAKRLCIGVEENKPDAIEALRRAVGGDAEVCVLRVKYPQGGENSSYKPLRAGVFPRADCRWTWAVWCSTFPPPRQFPAPCAKAGR